MNKHETINYKELKKMMKLSIAIGVELGFYVACTQKYIVIDRWENKCKKKQRLYTFDRDSMPDIMTLVVAYSKLHGRKLSVW